METENEIMDSRGSRRRQWKKLSYCLMGRQRVLDLQDESVLEVCLAIM
jgi:hypothetical protein